jgi:hypothetical protein
MNPDLKAPDVNRASGAAIGFLIASLIFIALAVMGTFSPTVPAIDADRGAMFSSDLSEIHSNEDVSLAIPGWIDRGRGIVRLPIDTAMRIAAQEWQNPAQARADLISRAQKAAAPAPKPPPAANPFE